jgi:hypothetical protein
MEEEAQMKQLMKRLWKEDEGQDLIEYALLITLSARSSTMRPRASASLQEYLVQDGTWVSL